MDALERHFRAAWKQQQHTSVQVPAYGLAWDEFQSAIQQEIAKARLETLHDFYNENYEAIDSNAGLLNSVAADIAELSQTLKEHN